VVAESLVLTIRRIRNKTVGLSVTGDFTQSQDIIDRLEKIGLSVIKGKMGNVLTTHGGPNFFAISLLTE
jgi:hypothetical protein